MRLARAIHDLVGLGHDRRLVALAVTVVFDDDRLSRTIADQFRNVREMIHGLAVDLKQEIPLLEACVLGRAVRCEAPDDRPNQLIHAEFAVTHGVVVLVRSLAKLRRDLGMEELVAAPVVHRHRLGPVQELGILDVLVAVDMLAIQTDDLVARAQTRFGGGTVELDRHDRRRIRLARDVENAGQQEDGKQQVGRRSAQDDGGAGIEWLGEEGALLLVRRECFSGRRGAAGVVVSQELHKAAERDRRDLPAGAVAVGPANQLRPETDRKHFRVDAETPTYPVVAELVHEDEKCQHENEVRQVGREQTDDALHGSLNHNTCLNSNS